MTPQPSQTRLSTAQTTTPGQKHLRNEDAIQADENLNLYIVCDGASRPTGGHVASDVAAAAFLRLVREQKLTDKKSLEKWPKSRFQQILQVALEYAHKKVRAQHQEHRGIATTLTAAWIVDKHLFYVHVGDSRLYCFRNGKLYPALTKDQSLRHQLFGAVGINIQQAQHGILELRPGDQFLLCSDGLVKMLTDGEIETVFKEGGPVLDKVSGLMTAIHSKSIPSDDVSVIVLSYQASEMDDEEPTVLTVSHKIGVLKRLEFFKNFEFSEIETLNGVCETHFFPEGSTLMEEGAPADSMMVILKGDVAILESGDEVARRGPGNCLGEPALFHWDEVRMSTAVAKSDVSVMILDRRDWFGLAERDPRLGMTVYEQMAGSLRRKLQEESRKNSKERSKSELPPLPVVGN